MGKTAAEWKWEQTEGLMQMENMKFPKEMSSESEEMVYSEDK